jgi:hypothetical protein
VHAAGPARAENELLARARSELEALDFPAARVTLARALATGTNRADEVAEIYKLTGIVAGAIGDTEASTRAFERLLSLSPNASLEAGTSPKILKPFKAATANIARHGPLKVAAKTAYDPSSVTLVVANDPLGMVMSARAWFSIDGQPEQKRIASGLPPIAVPLPAGTRIAVRVAALDLHGNELVEIRDLVVEQETTAAEPPPEPPPAPERPPRGRPLYANAWLWGGVTVAFGATASYFGLAYRGDRDDLDAIKRDSANHRFAEASAIEASMRDHALYANLALGAAGVTAIVAIYLFATDRPSSDGKLDLTRTAIAPVALRGGGGISLARPF